MFGELIGLWAAAAWRAMGSPANVRLVELGPGRGTMMQDALRAAKVMPDFRAAIVLHMVEVSPALERLQRQSLTVGDVPVSWHRSIEEVPDGPVIILANEFFDALPVHQAVMCVDGWHERVVKIADNGSLQFGHARDPIPLFDQMMPRPLRNAPIGAIFEWRADQIALEIGRRVVHSHGAALIIDYGHVESAAGDTFQAVGRQAFTNPLQSPGTVDLTAHVDFQAFAHAAQALGADVHGPIDQATFLRRLGIETRADALKKGSPLAKNAEVNSALLRLTSEEGTGMGKLFKAIAFADPKLGELPGFEQPAGESRAPAPRLSSASGGLGRGTRPG
jgi:SAM-dependent MidA family methyltransferase